MNALLTLAAIFNAGSPAIPDSPQTTVELRVTSVDEGDAKLLEQALLREIGDRLLEDGYRLVPPGASASVSVWIHVGEDAATIESRGVAREAERVPDGDPQVMLLELQQLTTGLVDAVRPAAAEPAVAVAIDLVGETEDPQLLERLQIGLLERGFALTRAPAGEDLRVCVVASDDGVFVHAVAGSVACADEGAATRVGEDASVEIVRELVLDEASASLVRLRAQASVAAPEPAPRTDEDRPLEDPQHDDAGSAPSPAPPRPTSLTLSASAGLFGRGGGADPAFDVELRGGRRRGVGAGLNFTLVPSRAESLRVIEYLPTATFDWRLGLAERGLAILGAFAGAHVHTYSYADASAEAGVRVGASFGASVRLAYLAPRGGLVFGGVRGGWTGGRWIHLAAGEASWRRSSVFVGVELGAGWDFELGRRR